LIYSFILFFIVPWSVYYHIFDTFISYQARFGVALLDSGTLKLKGKGCEHDARPIHGGAPLHGPPLPKPAFMTQQQQQQPAAAAVARSQAKKDRAEARGETSPKKKQRVEAAAQAAAAAAFGAGNGTEGAGSEDGGSDKASNGNGHQNGDSFSQSKKPSAVELASTTTSAHIKGEAPPPCRCQACEGYSRASLCALFKVRASVSLLSMTLLLRASFLPSIISPKSKGSCGLFFEDTSVLLRCFK